MANCLLQLLPNDRVRFARSTTPSQHILLFIIISLALHCLLLIIPKMNTVTGVDVAKEPSHFDVYLNNDQQAHHQSAALINPAHQQKRKKTYRFTFANKQGYHHISLRRSLIPNKIVKKAQERLRTSTTRQPQLTTAKTPTLHMQNKPTLKTKNSSLDPSAVARLLRHALLKHFQYPFIARQNAWQGKVVLNIRVEADGRVHAIRVLHPSHYPVLNRAATRAANAIGKIPAARILLAGQSLTFRVPVAYRLQP